MSTIRNEAVLYRTEVTAPEAELDLGITAMDTAIVRMPYLAGAIDSSVVRMPYLAGAIDSAVVRMPYLAGAIDSAVVRMPYLAGALELRASKTVLTVG